MLGKGAGGAADLWDSAVESSESLQVPYGKPSSRRSWCTGPSAYERRGLRRGERHTDGSGRRRGRLGGEWLARACSRCSTPSCDLYDDERKTRPTFRSEVSVPAPHAPTSSAWPSSSTASASALRLDPGWTTYDKTVLYVAHDVTAELNSGKHAVGVELGNGWWNPTLEMDGH